MNKHERSPQKTIPHAGNGTREVRNEPDTPSVLMKPFLGFAIEFPGQKSPSNGNGTFEVRTSLKDTGHGREVIIVQLTPKAKQPLTPLFKNEIDGHKVVGGGGTSKDSIRRAKKKLRKSPRK